MNNPTGKGAGRVDNGRSVNDQQSTPSTATRTTPKDRRIGSKKIGRGLVSLSTVAIMAVYGAGYYRTNAAASQVAAQTDRVSNGARNTSVTSTGTSAQVPTTSPTTAPTTIPITIPTTAPRAAPTASPTSPLAAPNSVGTYKDGTYVGQGMSRHGGFQVQVVVRGGKIVSTAILRSSTRYPVSAIRPLPPTVLAQQSTNVDLVSGATDSSNAYLDAVDNALAQAA